MLNVLKNVFGYVAGASSILALVLLFFNNKVALIVALAFYCVSVTLLVVAVYRAVCKSLSSRHKDKFVRTASFCTFSCDDDKNARFETMRLIQAKVPFLDCIEHKFKWNGKGSPKIFVNDTDVTSSFKPNGKAGAFDSINIKLGKVISYNESASFKVAFTSQYSEVSPFIRCKIDEPTKVLQFRVLLGYKKENPGSARIYRRLIDSEVDAPVEDCGVVDFDMVHKVYFHVIENPEIGYYYSIEWNK